MRIVMFVVCLWLTTPPSFWQNCISFHAGWEY